jgi:hypothetical protein
MSAPPPAPAASALSATAAFTPVPGLHVVGVRHHSPACARLVAHTLQEVRPAHVLVEGPADMNGRLAELLLPHAPPLAVFSAWREEGRASGAWTPFCDYSPEWVALQEGTRLGARVAFMDLPAWDRAFAGVRNRYADGERRYARAVEALCARLGMEGLDGLWDHLFEQPAEAAELAGRLALYFESLRDGDAPAGDGRDGPREDFMRAHVEAALGEGRGAVVVVCGGFHAPFLARSRPRPGASFPPVPAHPDARSYLVPYAFQRLDAFTGYEAGMPSPAFYQAVWEEGPRGAPARMLRAAVEALRARGQHVSAADLIAATALSEGLARLRGHASLTRSDLLDGLAGALVKDALDAALPWTERGVLSPRTHPLLAEVLRAFSGERTGRLHEDTPRPPLLRDVERVLAEEGLAPGAARRTLTVDLREEGGRAKSRVLHRLRVLGLPGFTREAGPRFPTEAVLEEAWALAPARDFPSAVIEVSGWGPTLEQAAAGRLEAALLDAGPDLSRLSLLLAESLFVGAGPLASRVLAEVALLAGREVDLGRLGEALGRLLSLWRHDVLLGAKGSAEVGALVRAAFERGLWLLEGLDGPTALLDAGQVRAVAALRDALRHGGGPLGLSLAHAEGVLARRVGAATAPPAVKGACLGALWSLGRLSDGEAAAARALRGAALPATLGDFLGGLFALAREEVVRAGGVQRVLDEVVAGLPEGDFLVALPALRLAFSFFPPAEKAALARAVLALHGRAGADARTLLRAPVPAEVVAEGLALDAEVERVLARFGLLAAPGGRPEGTG